MLAKTAGFQTPWSGHPARAARRAPLDLKMNVAVVQNSIEVHRRRHADRDRKPRAWRTPSAAADFPRCLMPATGPSTTSQLTPNVTRVNGVYVMRFAGSRQNQADYSVDASASLVSSGSNPNAPLTDYTETVQEMRVDVANNTAEFGTVGQASFILQIRHQPVRGSAFDSTVPRCCARAIPSPARAAAASCTSGLHPRRPVYIPAFTMAATRPSSSPAWSWRGPASPMPTSTPPSPPTPWRSGDFSSLAGTTVLDPMGGNAPFAGNRIPPHASTPYPQAAGALLPPQPNRGDANLLSANNYQQLRQLPAFREWYATERIDHRISDKVQLYRPHRAARLHQLPPQFGSALLGLTRILWDTKFYTFSTPTPFVPHGERVPPGLLLHNNPALPVRQRLRAGEGSGPDRPHRQLPDYPRRLPRGLQRHRITGIDFNYQYRDSKGGKKPLPAGPPELVPRRHALKVAGQFSRSHTADRFLATNLYGSSTFTNRYTGHAYADFLLGHPVHGAPRPENPFDDKSAGSTTPSSPTKSA